MTRTEIHKLTQQLLDKQSLVCCWVEDCRTEPVTSDKQANRIKLQMVNKLFKLAFDLLMEVVCSTPMEDGE